MRTKIRSSLVLSLVAVMTLAMMGGGNTAVVAQASGRSVEILAQQPRPTPVVPPGFVLPPGVELPPGFTLPPGVELPPGLEIPSPEQGIPGFEILPDNVDRPSHGSVAGLGESGAMPTGTPMQLSLRPGWQLTSIRGGAPDEFLTRCGMGDPTRRSPECALDRGIFQVTLHFDKNVDVQSADLRMTQSSDPEPLAPLVPEPPDPLAPLVPVDVPPLAPLVGCAAQAQWSGWVLQTGDGGQNIWVPVWTCLSTDGKYTILNDSPRGATETFTPVTMRQLSSDAYELTISGFCLNADRHGPSAAHSYGLGVLSDDYGLNKLQAAIKSKRLLSFSDRMTFQQYVWVYSEGQDLIESDWDAIANLK